VGASVLLSNSLPLTELLSEARCVARSDAKVLITGESGVGKELVARYIHEHSSRSRRPLVTVNCAGVPESLLESELFGHVRGSFTDAHRDRRGLLEMADGGTIFLDEVGEMSLRMQALLLRFLETGEIQRVGSDQYKTTVDVRVISATNRDLIERTREREFREDLYYRLNVVHLVVPPLRDRRDDIAPLFEHYVRALAEQNRLPACELTSESRMFLESASWPGNVRELRNVAERVALRYAGRTVSLGDLRSQMGRNKSSAPTAAARMDDADAVARSHQALARAYYERMTLGHESFWTTVYQPFMLRDVTRETVRAIIRLALAEARGNYRIVLQMFNLPASDYKRFLSFLQKHECRVPFQLFREMPSSAHGSNTVSCRPAIDESKVNAAV
jgi:transcriptional regulator with GAF, ATPase, and Fis domain